MNKFNCNSGSRCKNFRPKTLDLWLAVLLLALLSVLLHTIAADCAACVPGDFVNLYINIASLAIDLKHLEPSTSEFMRPTTKSTLWFHEWDLMGSPANWKVSKAVFPKLP